MGWKIKEVTQDTGFSADTLRYYEKLEIVAPQRGENGRRYYDEADILALKYIAVLRYAQFSLAEIKEILTMPERELTEACYQDYRNLLNAKIDELQQGICNYKRIIDLLDEGLSLANSPELCLEDQERLNEYVRRIFLDIKTRKDD